jgi:hypothetical protein
MTENTHTTVVSETVGNFPNIESLAAEHTLIAAKADGLPPTSDGDEEARRLFRLLWSIRALIEDTPAMSLSELHAKTRIFEVEAARDPEFECHCAGSARGLARSIAADVARLQTAA